ncbi:MAG: NAD(+) synthase, partial [Planctomycetaceae bacterium]|nr:NAD(+) synthase [Planctomycetaceae bacterium]
MGEFGFIRVGAAVSAVKVADCGFNVQKILELLYRAVDQKTQIVAFPELSVTAYTCGDLFFQKTLIDESTNAVMSLLQSSRELPICFIIGAPVCHNSKLYNCAIVCSRGEILGIVPKEFLPNYSEFYEQRWFQSYRSDNLPTNILYSGANVPFGKNILFDFGNGKFAVEICEDVWTVIPPSSYHAQAGASLLFNISASNELIGKRRYIKSLLAQQSARCHAAYIYSSAGFGESTTDVVYTGNAFIYENGNLLSESERFLIDDQLVVCDVDVELLNSERRKNTSFAGNSVEGLSERYFNVEINLGVDLAESKLLRVVNPAPFIPLANNYDESCSEIFSIQVLGLAKRFIHTGVKSLILGVSGGLDSTLALLVCVKMADKLGLSRRVVCGVTMPGFGTSKRTYNNAIRLMDSLGIEVRDISIVAACNQHFKDISHDPSLCDTTYENVQARERTQILMDLSNQMNGIVVGTGDMSELALGWATYNGDQMSMYGVNAGVPKTLVRYLVRWVQENCVEEVAGETLRDILDTPVSPELLPKDSDGGMTQFTEDLIGFYELHDFFLFYVLRYGFSPRKIYFLAVNAFCGVYDG